MATTILLADDHNVFRECLRDLLNREDDLEVVGEAASGRSVVELAEALQPHVVLMDISMPELNGIDATAQVMSVSPDTKILALSRGYLLKNARFEEVLYAVRVVVSGQSYLSPQVAQTVIDGYVEQLSAGKKPASPDLLSPREREVLQHVARGHTYREIGEELFIAEKTVA